MQRSRAEMLTDAGCRRIQGVSVDTPAMRRALARGRAAYAKGGWREAYDSLRSADAATPLEPDDLELLARAAYMLGRDDEYVRGLERAHYGHLDAGDVPRAVGCTWWIGLSLLMSGDAAPATGWFARGERLLLREGTDCAERGWLLLGEMLRRFAERDFQAAHDLAATAVEIGERFGERDLLALAVMDQGHALLELGRTSEGLRLVDESMVAVTSGELSPIVAGILYCNTIAVCRDAFEVRRAREWTAALTLWCERQPDMVAHRGVCLVHRAEIMLLRGDWEQALDEARRVESGGVLNRRASSAGLYLQAEVHRLRGEFEAAEDAFRLVTTRGRDVQPGLALLRLAEGKCDAALAAIRRTVGETAHRIGRASLLPAHVEISLAAGEFDEATRSAEELAAIAETQGADALCAMSAYARGGVALARGATDDALVALREALVRWLAIEAPYEVARTRVALARACAELGDLDGAKFEFDAARVTFDGLGALPDLRRLDSPKLSQFLRAAHGLSPRELEVLRRVASGATNRSIADALVISERTVDRHVSNIYAKLGVSSRAAATAYAYEHGLV